MQETEDCNIFCKICLNESGRRAAVHGTDGQELTSVELSEFMIRDQNTTCSQYVHFPEGKD